MKNAKENTVWHKIEFLHQEVDSKSAENMSDLSTGCPERVQDKGRSVRPKNIYSWYTPATGHRSHCQCSKSTVKETQRGSLSVMDEPPPAWAQTLGVILTENRAKGRNIQRRARSVSLCKNCFCCLCLHMPSLSTTPSAPREWRINLLEVFVKHWRKSGSAAKGHDRISTAAVRSLSPTQSVWDVLWRPQDNKRPADRCRLCLLSHPTFTSSSRMKRSLLTAAFKEQPASKYNYTQLYCIIMK